MNILVAEDEKDLRDLLTISLEREGYTVFAVGDGLSALEIMRKGEVDLAVLDVMMPHLDGFNLLRKIRPASAVPVIFLTARADEMDKVLGLGLGADDYMVKPFSMAELLARIGAQLRRNTEYAGAFGGRSAAADTIAHGALVLDVNGCCVHKNAEQIELNAKEYKLLKYLMQNPARVFTKKQLYREVWDEDLYYDDNTIMVHICHLRNKIETDPKNPRYLKTIRGIGYKFDPKAEEQA